MTWQVLGGNSGAPAPDKPPQALTAATGLGSVPSRQLRCSSCQGSAWVQTLPCTLPAEPAAPGSTRPHPTFRVPRLAADPVPDISRAFLLDRRAAWLPSDSLSLLQNDEVLKGPMPEGQAVSTVGEQVGTCEKPAWRLLLKCTGQIILSFCKLL